MLKKDRTEKQAGVNKILRTVCLILLTVTLISGCATPISDTDTAKADRDFLDHLISDTESEPITAPEQNVTEEFPDAEIDTDADTTTTKKSETTEKTPETTEKTPETTEKTPETTEKSEETTKKVDSADSKMVWIPTKGGKKYHKSSDCSNMDGPRKVTLSEAKSLGFTACKRCYK